MPPQETSWDEVAHKRAIEKKTHASFPQLKYPSLRDEGLRDPVQWLSGKAMDDGAEGLWRVHDKLYDLTFFMSTHPGGEEWLELTKGTDITEAFEVHHLNPSIKTLLDKFYIRDAKSPRNSPFTFDEEGFYVTLKSAVYEELKKVPKDAHKVADRITDGILFTLLTCSALSAWAQDYWAATFFYIISAFCLAVLTVACHNYIHRRPNWRMYLFNLSMWSYRDFRVSHVISHHLFPNTLMDLEISAFEPLIFFNPIKNMPFYGKFAIITELILFPFMFILSFIRRFLFNFFRPGFFQKHYRWHDGVGLLLPLWMWIASGSSFSHVIYTWLWINCTGSLIFYCIGTNAAHHHPGLMKDGDEPKSQKLDWAIHQLEAVSDRRDINSSIFTVMTFFGDHALHHLFPTLDHAVLKYLYPVFSEICEKYQAKHRVSTQVQLILGQIKEVVRTKYSTVEDRYRMWE